MKAVSDLDRQWTLATNDQKEHLKSLQQKGSKREVLFLFTIVNVREELF